MCGSSSCDNMVAGGICMNDPTSASISYSFLKSDTLMIHYEACLENCDICYNITNLATGYTREAFASFPQVSEEDIL